MKRIITFYTCPFFDSKNITLPATIMNSLKRCVNVFSYSQLEKKEIHLASRNRKPKNTMLQMHAVFKHLYLQTHYYFADEDSFYSFNAPERVQKREKRNGNNDASST
jgi:hypothetical protein